MSPSIYLYNVFPIHENIHYKEVNWTLCSDISYIYYSEWISDLNLTAKALIINLFFLVVLKHFIFGKVLIYQILDKFTFLSYLNWNCVLFKLQQSGYDI